MQVAVHAPDELEARAASALASHPGVERVGLIGRTPSGAWAGRVVEVEDASGFEVVLGSGGLEPAREAGAILVVPGAPPDDGPTVGHASPTGLGRVLAAALGGGAIAARTVTGDAASGGRRFEFPPPVGSLTVIGEDEGVAVASLPGALGAVAGELSGRTLGVVDEAIYLSAVTLAAGAFVAHHALAGPVPVWSHGDEYLAACQSLGVVVAEGISPAAS